ncbi:MAG: hypothetical protein Q8K86_10705 [Candidatus Nanopelagicaceae bacterium]|nr:hypothetical protein [Candidatus Nanopelagicaceae bacterium]
MFINTAGICPKVAPFPTGKPSASPSFIEVLNEKPKAKISICSFTSGRAEIRKTLHTWRNHKGVSPEDVCIIVAEFGYRPTIFRTKESREGIDKYVFAYQPSYAPQYNICWWRNVPCFQATTPYLLHTDSDVAFGPNLVKTMLDKIEETKKMPAAKYRPIAIHPTEMAASEESWATWDNLKPIYKRNNHECFWLFDANAYKKMRGWPEKWIGGGEQTPMDPKISKVFFIKNIDLDGLCHVKHERIDVRWKYGATGNGYERRETQGDIYKYVH